MWDTKRRAESFWAFFEEIKCIDSQTSYTIDFQDKNVGFFYLLCKETIKKCMWKTKIRKGIEKLSTLNIFKTGEKVYYKATKFYYFIVKYIMLRNMGWFSCILLGILFETWFSTPKSKKNLWSHHISWDDLKKAFLAYSANYRQLRIKKIKKFLIWSLEF